MQVQREHFRIAEYGWYFALDCRPVRNATDAGDVDRNLGAVFSGKAESAHSQVALCDRIDLAIKPLQRCDQQRAATQALGIGNRGDRDIDCLPGLGKGRQARVHDHSSDVFQLQIGARRNRHAQPLQHADKALRGEGGLGGLVAGAIEADHESVAHQLVLPDAADRGEILDPVGMRWSLQHEHEYGAEQQKERVPANLFALPVHMCVTPQPFRTATA